eukprot:Em0239g7a
MVSEVDSCKWSIDKLDSSNWMTWKFQMKHLLLSKGLWGIVDGSERLAEDASVQQQAEFRKRAQTAFSTLVLSISSSQLYLITSCEEPAPAWVALRNHFERDTLVNKLMLKKQYFRMEMKEGSSIEAHIKAMKELTDKLAAIKAPISEEDQVVTLLGSLPSSYSTLVTALEARDAVSLSYVQQALIQEEQRMNVVDSKSDAGQSAVFDEKTCRTGICREAVSTMSKGKATEENHQERSLSKPKHIAKPVKTMEEDSELACGASSKSYNKENWIVDSGASSHMTQTQEFMVNYEEFGTPQKVCLGDGRTLEAFGKGKVIVTMVFKRVYFMKRKSEAFDKFKEFERCSTNECGLSIGIFRSDNGGEYISKEFGKFLLDKEYTMNCQHHTHLLRMELLKGSIELNGVCTYNDAQAGLSFKEKTTPFEKWKDKLSKKAEKLRFIGYSLQTKAYRLINDDTGKIIVRRDVIFNESDFQDEVVIQEIPKEVEWPEQVQEEVELEQEQQEQEDAEQSRYPRRMRIAPTRGTTSITEALESDLSEQWREAADSEYQSLMQNETWERVELPKDANLLDATDINVKLVKDDGAAKLADSVCYQSMVGSLLYAAIATRPDIAQAVGAVSKFNSCPTETHLTGVKRILRYLKGTINLGLKFEKTADSSIIGFSDADWAGDLDNRHSTSGNLFVMSGGAISWLSKKQPVVALSTTEAEYVALGAATQEVVWLRRLLSDIKASPKMPTIISEDNQGTIAIARNPVYHARTKHIDIKYHYVREALMDGVIDLVYCPTQQMTADILTKPLSRDRFETLRHEMGLKDIPQ